MSDPAGDILRHLVDGHGYTRSMVGGLTTEEAERRHRAIPHAYGHLPDHPQPLSSADEVWTPPMAWPFEWVKEVKTFDAIDPAVKAVDVNPGWKLLHVGTGSGGQTTLTYGWGWEER